MKFLSRLVTGVLMVALLSGCMAGYSIHTASRIENLRKDYYSVHSKAEVLARFGEPVKVDVLANGHEMHVYNDGLAWRGFFGFLVLIPVPLLLPVGFNKMFFEFEGDRLVGLAKEFTNGEFHRFMFPPIYTITGP